ncbi:MAG: FtsX-like permease family protein [Bacteroidota bacterium]
MLAAIAWKNVWRSKRRSGIMIAAIAAGLWGGVFAVGMFTGMYDAMVAAAIDRNLTHVQVHAPGFREERLIGLAIPNPDSVVAAIRSNRGVETVSPRTVIEAIAASPTSTQGVSLFGVDPGSERAATSVSRRMVAGSFFEGGERTPVVIGRKLAEKLGVKLRAKLVLSFQRPDGTIVYGAFRIAGLFDTEATTFDGRTVFVRRADLDPLVGELLIHEIAVRIASNDSLEAVAGALSSRFPALRVETWKDLAPELKITAESADITMGIFLGVILLALLFGITNTMLMSVLERTREFGVLIAIGMKRTRVFGMILTETLFLSLTGAVVGVACGSATVLWFGTRGIDLSFFAGGLSLYGISSFLYPVVHPVMYPTVAIMVVVAACASAVYPGVRAVRLRPATAIATFG